MQCKPLDDETLETIQSSLEGTARSLTDIIDANNVDIGEDELEDRLLDGSHAVERSKCCEWWFRLGDLEFDEDRGGGVCRQCEPDAFD